VGGGGERRSGRERGRKVFDDWRGICIMNGVIMSVDPHSRVSTCGGCMSHATDGHALLGKVSFTFPKCPVKMKFELNLNCLYR
jgi:hypothetical protein